MRSRALTPQQRDQCALTVEFGQVVVSADVPVAVAMAGGYARNIIDTVRIHAATIRLACEVWG